MYESEKWKWSRSVVSDGSDPMDCSLPDSSAHGIFQAKVLEWGAIAFSEDCVQIRSDQSLSRVQLSATPWIAARQASLSITNSLSSLRLTSIESVMPSSHLILCHPLLLLPPIPPSIRVFSNELTLLMRWPKYWSFSFSIIPSKEIPGLISFRMDWLDLLAVQGTLKSLLYHHSSKASILPHISDIIYLSFSVWLTSLRKIFSRSICVAAHVSLSLGLMCFFGQLFSVSDALMLLLLFSKWPPGIWGRTVELGVWVTVIGDVNLAFLQFSLLSSDPG